MAEVQPFRGLRYDPDVVDQGEVLAPPYDVIDAPLQDALYARAMQNVVRFELGRDYPDDVPLVRDRYTRARDHLAAWRRTGAVVLEDRPALYLHAHAFHPPTGGPLERVGVLAAVTPVAWEAGVVLRHEHTLSGPKQDRMRLLETTGVQGSPVFALWEDAEAAAKVLRRHLATTPPTAEAVTDGENGHERHRLWVLPADGPGGDTARAVIRALADARLFIADGHHRYETGLAYAAAHPERPAPVLMYLAALDDPSHVVLATHRIVAGAPIEAPVLQRALEAGGYRWEAADGPRQALRRMARLRGAAHAFGVVAPAGVSVVHRPRREAASPRARLDVTVLQEEVLTPHLGVDAAAVAAGGLAFSREAEEVVRAVRAGGGLGFLLSPTTVDEVVAVARAGESMPQKSTYFVPKVPTGLVLLPVA
ncbi:MAG TPA: DUF1015 domain-containing protein [Candidatus Micrarchaeia archaeon]|nr:DUF1015 domain-containing protein [Candidatus Micrarchaeia archaeon]